MTMGSIGADFQPLSRLTEGWNTLWHKAHQALTFFHHDEEPETEKAPEAQRWGLVATDIIDHDDRLELRMEIPGVNRDDLNVSITASQVTVSGKRHAESTRKSGNAVITERAFGSFSRSFPLPSGVDAESAQAKYADGVLAIDLPKKSKSKLRQVPVA